MGDFDFLPVFILALAISIDGLSVGVTYGIRNIKLGVLPLCIISGFSTLAVYLTISIGTGIAFLINRELAKYMGSIILIFVGAWLVYSSYINLKGNEEPGEEKTLFLIKIKPLGIIIKILKEPVKADFDKSGTINISEAVFLGFALALDALGAGLGAGLSGFSNFLIPLVIGIFNFIVIYFGFVLGKRVGKVLPEHFELFPGLIIILLGLKGLF